MRIDRPLVFFDLETTGPSASVDRIVQFAALKRHPDGTTTEWQTLVNPLVPIPPEATEVHGIDDAAVADAPTFARLAGGILRALSGCDLAGYNVRRFDVPLLRAEFARAKLEWSLEGVRIVDAFRVFTKMEPRDLAAASRLYLGEEHTGAHDALADVRATARVLDAQLARYTDLPGDVGGLAEFCQGDDVDIEGKLRWRGEEVVINFGAQKGRSLRWLAEHDAGFLEWICRSDFSREVKRHATAALKSRPAKTEPPPEQVPPQHALT